MLFLCWHMFGLDFHDCFEFGLVVISGDAYLMTAYAFVSTHIKAGIWFGKFLKLDAEYKCTDHEYNNDNPSEYL
ncbi:hypothetical protein SAMN03084138_00607 [Enterovibrio norvegicus DSM 15893]|uniref:Uncharacterized protein n=1 Tax=Enterovibrio norvegicus DSM 15893 TaxID=1121869 RepID=A0A1I5KF49_9GAMM|nr:hypothetical protein SAMN03084138_00607 [Enterovibrio norvegicus DSM 15893]